MSSVTSPTSSRTESPAPQPARARANRAALRDYYGLKPTVSNDSTPEPSPRLAPDLKNDNVVSELDGPNFDPELHVQKVLATNRLVEILQIERGLIYDIKSLNGEKKALVYDNYSKLIAATNTIRSMRNNMGPLMPEGSRLNDDMSQIATIVENLAMKPESQFGNDSSNKREEPGVSRSAKRLQLRKVKWALDAPRRLAFLLEEGKRKEAEDEWKKVDTVLRVWSGVGDVKELRQECEQVMKTDDREISRV